MKELWQRVLDQWSSLLKRDFKWLILLLICFLLLCFLGAWIPQKFPWFSKTIMEHIMENFSELLERMQSKSTIDQIFLIFSNNITVAITALLSGFIMLPFLPLFFLCTNGLLIGMLYHYLAGHIALESFIVSLIPHGIFEIPAFLIAVFLGVKISLIPYRLWVNSLNDRENKKLFVEYFRELPYYLLLIVGLLVVAAIIEMTISAFIVENFKI